MIKLLIILLFNFSFAQTVIVSGVSLSHDNDVAACIDSGYGGDVNVEVRLESLSASLAYAQSVGASMVVRSTTGASSYLENAYTYYPDILVVMPSGSNSYINVFDYEIPQVIVATGEGTDSNHTGYKAEFVDDNPLGTEHLSSFSNGVIAGKLLKIKEQRAGTWWNARYAAQQTATASTANSGYGIINVNNAIAFAGSLPDDPIQDPTPPDPPVPEIGIVSLTATRDRDNITLSFSADNAVTYNIYRDGVFLTTTEDTEYMDTPDRSENAISYYVTAGEQVSNTVSFNYRRYSKIIFKN